MDMGEQYMADGQPVFLNLFAKSFFLKIAVTSRVDDNCLFAVIEENIAILRERIKAQMFYHHRAQ